MNHTRRIKLVEFALGIDRFEAQLNSWQIVNNTDDGDKQFTLVEDGESREETDDDYALELTFFADWRSAGVSEWLWAHDREIVTFTLDHLPDIPDEHQQFTGRLYVKAPSVGGDARTTEMTEVTLQIIGRPDKTRF